MTKTPVKKLSGVAFGFLTRKNPASLDEAKALLTLTYAPRVEVNDFPALASIADRWWAKKAGGQAAPKMRKVARRRRGAKKATTPRRKKAMAARREVAPQKRLGRPRKGQLTLAKILLGMELLKLLPKGQAAATIKAIFKIADKLGGPIETRHIVKGLEQL
jgi:hypothetical protein